jgi:hypothetical protein
MVRGGAPPPRRPSAGAKGLRPSTAFALAAATISVGSCTRLIGPTVPVGPGDGKSEAAFEADRRGCTSATDRAVQPMANDLNLRGLARTRAQVDADNARIQDAYDASFVRCMTDRGEVVSAPPKPGGPAGAPDEELLDASNSPVLTDANSRAAQLVVAKDVRQLRRACPGEEIQVQAHAAPIADGVKARLVVVSQPRGGVCMGARGETDYLLAKGAHGWSLLLAGIIGIRQGVHAGFRDVQLAGLGANCSYDYQWDGARYREVRATDCPVDDGPVVGGTLD